MTVVLLSVIDYAVKPLRLDPGISEPKSYDAVDETTTRHVERSARVWAPEASKPRVAPTCQV
jgi:hypothetical protein